MLFLKAILMDHRNTTSMDLPALKQVMKAGLTTSDTELAVSTLELIPGGLNAVVQLNRRDVLGLALGEDLINADPEVSSYDDWNSNGMC